jgi:hypothetical protein
MAAGDLTTLEANEVHPKLMTQSSDIINCTKADKTELVKTVSEVYLL